MELEFKVTMEEANILIAGLQELPFKLSNAIILKLQSQAKEQIESKEEIK